jgi:hypothetical protein
MIEISKQFDKGGFHFTLIKRFKQYCIYQKTMNTEQGVINHFEVHIIRIRPKRFIKRSVLETGERLACNEEFGTWAWDYPTLELAEQQFQKLNHKHHDPIVLHL